MLVRTDFGIFHLEFWGITAVHVALCEVGGLIFFLIIIYFSWGLLLNSVNMMFPDGEQPLRRMVSAFPIVGQASRVLVESSQTCQKKMNGRVVNFFELLFCWCWEPENLIDQDCCVFSPRKGEIPFPTSCRQAEHSSQGVRCPSPGFWQRGACLK